MGFGLKTKTGAFGLIFEVEALGGRVSFAGEAAADAAVGTVAGAREGVEWAVTGAVEGILGRKGGISAILALGDVRMAAIDAGGVDIGPKARALGRTGDWMGLVATDAEGCFVGSRPIDAMSSGKGVLSCNV